MFVLLDTVVLVVVSEQLFVEVSDGFRLSFMLVKTKMKYESQVTTSYCRIFVNL